MPELTVSVERFPIRGAFTIARGSKTEAVVVTAEIRDGGAVGYVGVPHGGSAGVDVRQMFNRNVTLAGGVAPARAYLPELLADVLAGVIDPAPVFDRSVPLSGVPEGYRAMDERTALKVRVTF